MLKIYYKNKWREIFCINFLIKNKDLIWLHIFFYNRFSVSVKKEVILKYFTINKNKSKMCVW